MKNARERASGYINTYQVDFHDCPPRDVRDLFGNGTLSFSQVQERLWGFFQENQLVVERKDKK
jgi:hypothetical protein